MLFSFHMLTTCSDCLSQHMHAHTHAPILHVLLRSRSLTSRSTHTTKCTCWMHTHVLIISGNADQPFSSRKTVWLISGDAQNHMVGKLRACVHVFECVGENVCARETNMNYGGEQSGGRKLSWLSLLWNDSIVKKGEVEMRGTSTSYRDLYRPTL